MKSLIKKAFPIAIILGLGCINSSCKKEKPTLAKVRVLNENQQAVEDAEVVLWANPDPVLKPTIDEDVLYTDEDGLVIFDYTDDFDLGTAGFRLLDIKANSGDSIFGTGIIKIVEEEENGAVVILSAP